MLLTLVATRAHAQLAVIDPANLVQAVQIAERAQRHYEELQAQYRTILRMAKGLGNMDRYRIPAIAASSARRRQVALRAALAAGPQQRRCERSGVLGDHDPAGASGHAARRASRPRRRRTLERQYATIEITDSVAQMGGHQVGALRGYRRAAPAAPCSASKATS